MIYFVLKIIFYSVLFVIALFVVVYILYFLYLLIFRPKNNWWSQS